MNEPVKVLIADDHALFRRGVVELLREEPAFSPVGEASNGPDTVRLCRNLEPDVVLLDVHMPGGSGLEVIRNLKEQPTLKVLMLTISEKDEDLMAAIQAGADGYMLKGTEPEGLIQAIRQVAAGQAVLSPQITAKVMKAAADAQTGDPQISLSPREQEVLTELAGGATTAEIAVRLVISTSTVKTHVHHILEKLEAANRTEAVARATALGLINPRS
jgi:DNA-binding NarL/FixJ family response regulator